MKAVTGQQKIQQLDQQKGGYCYLQIEEKLVEAWKDKRHTRLICLLDGTLSLRCGLNHLGDGNYFIILSKGNLKKIGKSLGDTVAFHLTEDPDPLGVDMPEVLESLLEQDQELQEQFNQLTLGKRRSIIHQIGRLKDIDRQVAKALQLIPASNKPRINRQP